MISTNPDHCENQKTPLEHHKSPLNEVSTWPRFERLLKVLASHTNYCEYALEFRAFLRRILLLRKARKVQRPFRQLLIVLGPHFEKSPTSRLRLCHATHARISDSQKFYSRHPWATPIDLAIFLEGWDVGAEWGTRNEGIPREEIG